MVDLEPLTKALRAFANERDWDQFHSPKNLAIAVAVEAAELLEIFQWLSQEQSRTLDAAARQRVEDEVADVQIYLARLADIVGVDVGRAVENKLKTNEARYPASRVKGSARKYTDYRND